jgi:hypothetical protein
MRSILDELEGVSRSAAGKKSLVFESIVNGTAVKGMYETGYDGAKSVVNSGYAFEREGIDSVVSRGSLSKVGKWSFRDELQQRLVRQARRLPYEVPAFYAADKLVTKPLFGGAEEETGPKKKWYDPTRGVDLAKDLAKTTLFQMGGFMLPGAAAGAAKASSINFFKTAEQRIQDTVERGAASTVNKVQEQIFRRGLNLKGALQEVGHELASVFDKSIKFGERSSGALASGFLAASGTETNPVGTLYRQRHGATTAPVTTASRLRSGTNLARDIFKGNNVGIKDTQDYLGLIPGYNAVKQGLIHGYKQYKNLGYAQEIIDTENLGTRFNIIKDDIRRVNKLSANSSDAPVNEIIRKSIDNIQLRRTSPLNRLVQNYNKQTSKSNLGFLLHQKEYKNRLAESLSKDHGMDKDTANFFADSLDINKRVIQKSKGEDLFVHPVNRISIGDQPLQNGETFFQDIIDRFNSSKVAAGKKLTITGDDLYKSVRSTDQQFIKNPILGEELTSVSALQNSITTAFQDSASTSVLSPRKLFRGNFLQKSFAEADGLEAQKTLTTKAANILGIDTSGSQDVVFNQLRLRGIDPNNPAQLRAYLINNNAMTEGAKGGISGFFGFSGLSLDDFLDKEKQVAARLTNSLGAKDAKNATENLIVGKKADLVRALGVGALERQGQTLSDVKGYYNVGGNIINFNPIKTGAKKALEIIGTETKIPVININPLQMFGLKDFIGMSKAEGFQLTSGSAMHPFLGGTKADFYTWHSTGGFLGTKGKLYAHSAGSVDALKGTYRPIPVNSSGMIATTAELAAGKRVAQTSTATSFLGKVKEKLDYDTEQENSLFRFFGRLVNRQADINNEAVMAKTLSAELDTPFTIGGVGKSRQLVLRQDSKSGAYNLFDFESDKLVASHSQLMESFTRFANTTTNFGTGRKVARHLLENTDIANGLYKMPTSFKSRFQFHNAIMDVNDIVGVRNLNEIFEKDLTGLYEAAGTDKAAQQAYKNTRSAFSRLKKFENITDFSAQSPLFEHSSSIVSRADEYRSEVIRYLTQRHALNSGDSIGTMQEIISSIDDLVSQGIISSAERAEAQAAVAGTVFNLGAFETYQFEKGIKNGILSNPLERFARSRRILSEGTISSSLDPFTTGSSVSASSGGLNPLSKINPYFKKNFGMGKYIAKPKVSAFTGQDDKGFSYIPTFGTAAAREGGLKATLLSATGIHTYGNEKGFSLASVPISHGFNRLNKFFGSVGAKLDANHFYGPLDLYMRGMNAERVLPAVAIGATALAVDRTAGGYVNKKDDRGERVYQPLLLGGVARAGVEAQAAISGLTPGGMTYGQ